jgi:pimeloyl-ACP methyl ester carboxylesterase
MEPTRTTSLLTLPLVAALALSACRFSGDDAVAALEACRLPGVQREVRCGSVAMPEDPDQPGGRMLTVRYAVVPAVARNKEPDPVFVLAGGPGQAATRIARQLLPVLSEVNTRRDIVFVDQRGTGGSNALECKVDERSVAAALEPTQQLGRLADCLQSMSADLRQYATWIAVRDYEAVRAQLGVERINLWGGSYGTRVALEYMRQFPRRVRAAVLDGVAPPDMTLPVSFAIDADAALAAVVDLCERDERCRRRYPELAARIAELLTRAERGIDVRILHPLTGAPETLRLDRRLIASLLRVPLYAPQLASMLPYALAQAAHDDYTPLVSLSSAVSGNLHENFAVGMHFSIICAEDLPRVTAAQRTEIRTTRLGTAFVDLYQQACRGVPSRPVPSAFYSVAGSATPVLVLSGGLDPATPPRHGTRVAALLGNARHLVAPHLGHIVSTQGCAPMLIARFIRDASFEHIDGECLDRIPAATFFEPLSAASAKADAK